MTDDEIIDKLKNMTREVRDLKTAHERGLGTTRFYRYSISIMAQANTGYSFVARVADGEPQTPVIIALARVEEPTDGYYLNLSFYNAYHIVHHPDDTYTITPNANGSYNISVSVPTAGDLTVDVISSSKLKEFHQS